MSVGGGGWHAQTDLPLTLSDLRAYQFVFARLHSLTSPSPPPPPPPPPDYTTTPLQQLSLSSHLSAAEGCSLEGGSTRAEHFTFWGGGEKSSGVTLPTFFFLDPVKLVNGDTFTHRAE